MERLKNKFKTAKSIAIVQKNEDFKEWSLLGIDYIVDKVSVIDEILTQENTYKFEFDLPIYSIKEVEQILSSLDKELKIVVFKFDRFENPEIKSYGWLLESIYNDLKRSDIFFIVSKFGFVILPFNQDSPKGIEILKDKVESFVEKKISDIKLKTAEVISFYKNSSLIELTEEKKYAQMDIFKVEEKTEHLSVDDPYVIMFALEDLKEEAALLFFDADYKKKVDPFLTLKIARRIVEVKNKGFSKEELEKTKERFAEKVRIISESFDKTKERVFLDKLSAETQLLSLPEVQANIIMNYNENASFKRIVREIEKDPAITSKILRFANSAFFGFKKEIKSVERAAIVLGMEEILGISLSVSYLSMFKSRLTKELYKYAIATLAISKYIEQKANINASITLGSVVHVIGNMFYAQYMEGDYKKLIKRVKKDKIKYERAEFESMPARSSEVGYKLSSLWSFPERIGQVIKNWLFPSVVSKFDTSLHLIHASAMMARALGYFYPGYSLEDLNYYTYNLFFKKFGVNLLSLFKNFAEEMRSKIEEMMYILS
ncbi:HDOD domain-containing protein [Hippea alviniae]|uniref:HDOD domain-containing protein n=1 Tax=Hippea alviniae TaxID=1279027 RepID=UPI00138AB250|nr:HDOD domain-containing protein [Hippea alviniae]